MRKNNATQTVRVAGFNSLLAYYQSAVGRLKKVGVIDDPTLLITNAIALYHNRISFQRNLLMKYEDYEVASIPYWCRNCDTAVDDLLRLPEPIAIRTDPIYRVCECCYNELCNDELLEIRKRPLHNETDEEWTKRTNAVSQKYGFGAEHEFCDECGCPQPHEPDCIDCERDQREKEMLCEEQDHLVMTNSV